MFGRGENASSACSQGKLQFLIDSTCLVDKGGLGVPTFEERQQYITLREMTDYRNTNLMLGSGCRKSTAYQTTG